jgi:multiple sugar transport system substrate-binding protein
LYSLGGRYFDEKWKPLYNSPEGVKALDLLKKSVSYGPANALELNHELADVAFFSEEVPMVLQWWSVTGEMLDPSINPFIDDTGFAVSFHPKNVSGMMGYGIADASPNKEAAYKLLEWVYSRTNAARLIEAGGVPVRRSTLEDESIKARVRIPEQWNAALQTLERGLWSRPKFKYAGVHSEIICTWVARALAGEVDSKEALDNAAKEVEGKLKELGWYG